MPGRTVLLVSQALGSWEILPLVHGCGGRQGERSRSLALVEGGPKQAMERDFTMEPEQLSILCAGNVRMAGVSTEVPYNYGM